VRDDAAWGVSGLNGIQTGLRTTRCERPGEDVETDCKQTSDSVQAKTETGGKTEALDAAGVDGDVGSGQVFFTATWQRIPPHTPDPTSWLKKQDKRAMRDPAQNPFIEDHERPISAHFRQRP